MVFWSVTFNDLHVKKIAFLSLILTLAFPVSTAWASFPTREEAVQRVMTNLSQVTSGEYTVEISAINNMYPAGEEAAYIDISGAYEEQADGVVVSTYDVDYDVRTARTTDGQGTVSVVLTNDKMFMLNPASGNTQWTVLPTDAYEDLSHETGISVTTEADTLAAITDIFNSDAIVVEQFSPVTLNNVTHSRTDFSVNGGSVVDYVRASSNVSDEDAAEARTYLNEQVTVYGHVIVNNVTMLPYQVSLTARVYDEAQQLDMLVRTNVTFTSFNQTLNLTTPTNARPVESWLTIMDSDTDGDGLQNEMEVVYHTNPNDPDSDDDGFNDYVEIVNGYDPNGPWQLDLDQDELGDRDEKYVWFTKTNSIDSDADGYTDATEVRNGYNPNGPGRLDSDKDGLSDFDELYVFHSNRFVKDTDGDGYSDGVEVFNGYNPNGSGR